MTELQTYDAIIDESMATRRFTLLLLAVFAGTALVLAIIGLYGALSYVVIQRQREIGVRVALGAASRDIARLVLGQGMTPAIVGLGAGLLASVAIGRVIESMLFSISSRDLMTYATVITMIVAGALAACLFPARRAASVDACRDTEGRLGFSSTASRLRTPPAPTSTSIETPDSIGLLL